jgi:alpha-D-xyloside xylohydrolase
LYSDAYDHRDYVRACATSGFAGILWCPEIRDAVSHEDLYRRLETNAFSAIMQLNCWQILHPTWKQITINKNNEGKLMPDWEKTEAQCRRIFQYRMQLIPYLYTAYADYHNKGIPPTRALVMDYPEDGNTRGIDDQYMFGPSLLVAPLFAGQSKRSVYLPKGDWYDFWTHEKFAGGRRIDVQKPIDQIPVFVKGNTLLPLAKPVDFVSTTKPFDITVHVFGDKPAPFTLYEDDGTTLDFEKGKQNQIELRWNGDHGTTTTTGDYHGPSRYKIVDWSSVSK